MKKLNLLLGVLLGSVLSAQAQLPEAGAKAVAQTARVEREMTEAATQAATIAGRTTAQIVTSNFAMGYDFLSAQLPKVGGNIYARKVKWEEKMHNRIPTALLERLIAKQILAPRYPGYIADFQKEWQFAEQQNKGSLWNWIRPYLASYGPNVYFSSEFSPTLTEALRFEKISPVHWYPAEDMEYVLRTVVRDALEKNAGFFAVYVKTPGKEVFDVLILDLQHNCFLSRNESIEQVLNYKQHRIDLGKKLKMLYLQSLKTKTPLRDMPGVDIAEVEQDFKTYRELTQTLMNISSSGIVRESLRWELDDINVAERALFPEKDIR